MALVRVEENPSFADTRSAISIFAHIYERIETYMNSNGENPRRVVRSPGPADPSGFVAIFTKPRKSLGVIEIEKTLF